MKAHMKSEVHILSCAAKKAAAKALQEGSTTWYVGEQEMVKNRMTIKAFNSCTHFLHIATFPILINLLIKS